MTTSTQKASTAPVILPGWGVSIILRRPVNGLICWVGEVQAADDHGLRITTMDWVLGLPLGMDWWFPWSDIAAMEVKTDAHNAWEPDLTQLHAQRAGGLSEDLDDHGPRKENL